MQKEGDPDEGTYVWDAELQDYKYVPPHRGVFGQTLYEGRRKLKALLAESRVTDPEFSIAEVSLETSLPGTLHFAIQYDAALPLYDFRQTYGRRRMKKQAIGNGSRSEKQSFITNAERRIQKCKRCWKRLHSSGNARHGGKRSAKVRKKQR